MEDWESLLSESVAVSPIQEQSILRWIMGDVEDPAIGSLNKILQIGSDAPEFDFGAGFASADHLGFGGDQFGGGFPNPSFSNRNKSSAVSANLSPNFKFLPNSQNTFHPGNLGVISHHHPSLYYSSQMMINQHQQEQNLLLPPQAIVDQIYNAAELIQTGNLVLAEAILARLNHQLSPIGKPFNRAAFYCKEALQLVLHTNSLNPNWSPISLVFKIGAYKSFSEISPLIHFANFTSNQALLESLEGFDRIHIIDFDIGFGGQWPSLMQELALRSGGGGTPSLKISAIASPSSHDLELGLTRDNLVQFANEINIAFQFDIASIDSLPIHRSENEAVAVNLPVGSLANHQLLAPMVLNLAKQLSPRIVVSVDRGCNRMDLPFANNVIHVLHSYSSLLESLDAGNTNADTLQKIERLLLQPGIEKIVLSRYRSPEKTQHWRAMFLSSGYTPIGFSNFTESQAECVVKRTAVGRFQVEKRQSSLVLCWDRKELISASAWRC